MLIRSMTFLAGLAVACGAPAAAADALTWQYLDARYQQPSDDSTRGGAAQVSVEANEHWVVQGGVGHVRLKESNPDLKVSQTRYDLSVGRVFDLGERVSALVSAGYTYLQYDTEVGALDLDERDHAANAQIVLRAALTAALEAEGSIGMLFDDEDASDPLWSAGLRYWFTPSASLLVGANGIASDAFDSDDVLYEVGFRFNLDGE